MKEDALREHYFENFARNKDEIKEKNEKIEPHTPCGSIEKYMPEWFY